MSRYAYNPFQGQRIQANEGDVDHAYIAHVEIPAGKAVAADDDGVATIVLGEAEQNITAGITNPAWPRALSVKGSAASMTGNVVITGENAAGEEITETIALDGTTAAHGAKAFAKITKIEAPVQVNTPVAQVETATVVGTITTAGNAKVTVTAAALEGSPKDYAVEVAADDDAAAIAGKIRAVLEEDTDLTALFTVSGENAAVVLTANSPAANDTTLNIAIDNDTCEGITTAATSANTTQGVAPDILKVGWNDILGIPYMLAHNTVLAAYLNNVKESTAPTVTVDDEKLEENTIDLNSALNGTAVDVYLIV